MTKTFLTITCLFYFILQVICQGTLTITADRQLHFDGKVFDLAGSIYPGEDTFSPIESHGYINYNGLAGDVAYSGKVDDDGVEIHILGENKGEGFFTGEPQIGIPPYTFRGNGFITY